ncbi:efflux RND transporter permease subunit, partial [Elioraea sp.]|uniref:efflux RND transporter permease subunit n=1 Tax=Elioraea sp. TaxID=2185103 RepID=UPI003F712DB5
MRQTGVGMGIQRQSTANTLAVAQGVKAEIERLKSALPEGIRIVYGYDESLFIAQSIYEVFHALFVALSMVLAVIFLFLRSLRATIIPAVAIPVSIIGSFIALAALGFSLNVLTLLGMVLAIGIVVDDAIVVLENIHRRIEEGEEPLVAAYRGARQIAFAVIATTLVLISVFLPISFLEGQTGRLFTEFGFALAASVLVSGFVALTLTPMMCSKLLRGHESDGRLVRWTEPAFVALNRGFRWALDRSLRAPILVLAGAGVVSMVAAALFVALPKEFAPTEDRGVVVVPITAPEGASFAYTREHVLKVEEIFWPYVERGDAVIVFASMGGFGRPAISNTANVFLRLAPWHERTVRQQDLTREIFPQVAAIPGVRAFAVNPGSLGQRGFRTPVQLVLQGPDYDTLVQWRDAVMERLREIPLLINIDSDYKETKPEMRVEIDRRRAADLGVSIQTIGRTIETMLGAREVGTYVERGNEYKVIMQAEAADRATPYDLQNIFVRTGAGALVPLSNLIMVSERARPQSLNREDRLRSITVTASLAPDVSLGEALDAVEAAAAEVLPPDARTTWRGQAREFKEGSSALYVTFGLALLIVFLVLAAQFESFVHPFIILLSTPLAMTGGLLALFVLGLSLNMFSQIGLILLIGLMAKNGILVVEFANQLRDQGLAVREAVLEASVARLRPILMTTIATILGAWPLAAATGAGAESREALGVVVIGGMGLATLVTLFAIPALYLLLAPLTKPTGEIARRLAALDSGVRQPHPQPAE